MMDGEEMVSAVMFPRGVWVENMNPAEGFRLSSKQGQDVSSTEGRQRMCV